MKIKYDQPKGYRVNKGSFKVEGYEHRVPVFFGLTIVGRVDNPWWCEELNKWCTTDETNGLECGTHNCKIKNLQQAIRHIKKHPELKKGTELCLCSNFMGYSIIIRI